MFRFFRLFCLAPLMKRLRFSGILKQQRIVQTLIAVNPEGGEFWQSKEHEIDFVTIHEEFFEVKLGRTGPLDFAWFPKIFPRKKLTVICQTPFETSHVKGISLHQFLLEED